MHSKIFFDHDYDFFINQDYEKNPSSCIKHQVHEMKDIHESHGGFPDTYNLGNTSIHQLWYDDSQVDYENIGKKLNMEVVTVSSIKQPAGQVIPWHRDTFFQIKKKFPDDQRLKVRANIFLQDWKMGHVIQYGDTIDYNWKAGQGHIWDSEVLHLGANVGFEDKFTLQVSGFYTGRH